MKVNIKTLKGTRFEIEVKLEDTVDDVKKNIEIVQGPDVYASARQILIHQGKVLKDDTTMEENEVSGNSSIVIMLSNMPPIPVVTPPPQPSSSITNPPSDLPPVTGAPPPPAVNQPQRNQPPPAAPSTGPNSSPLNLFPPAGASGDDNFLNFLRNSRGFQNIRSEVQVCPPPHAPLLRLKSQRVLPKYVKTPPLAISISSFNCVVTVDDILKMKVNVKTLKGTRFEIEVKLEETVADMKKNIETVKGPYAYPAARQMLIHQGKVLKDDTTMEENQVSENGFIVIMLSKVPETRSAPVAAPPPQPSSSTTNPPSNLPPVTGAPPPPTGPNTNSLDEIEIPENLNLLDFLRNCQAFQNIRSWVRANPQSLPTILHRMGAYNQQLARLLLENYDDIFRLIFEPVGEEEGTGQPASRASESFTITREEMEALDRLEGMGFNRSLVWVAFFACDKNEEVAINYMLDHMHEFDE
ncbi:hypothetical protein L2E82_13858 [Cichorium intybus]|uniref:Uncharacterized protein n=1 Tax=Cichorium intybus TaxID=13427 RepID=A0ACB9EYG1_CICIN|nr:hypothetical protein L2E82_13858 [Cichorium intybus]